MTFSRQQIAFYQRQVASMLNNWWVNQRLTLNNAI
jgi:hypothetical protein